MNATIAKFGHPDTLIADYDHWVVLLRPAQPTIGSLILAEKSDATALGGLDPAAYGELARVSADIETALAAAVSFEKINYLMLMMVDPHVHFHVIPRYQGSRALAGLEQSDAGWPGQPDLASAHTLSPDERAILKEAIRHVWPR